MECFSFFIHNGKIKQLNEISYQYDPTISVNLFLLFYKLALLLVNFRITLDWIVIKKYTESVTCKIDWHGKIC